MYSLFVCGLEKKKGIKEKVNSLAVFRNQVSWLAVALHCPLLLSLLRLAISLLSGVHFLDKYEIKLLCLGLPDSITLHECR